MKFPNGGVADGGVTFSRDKEDEGEMYSPSPVSTVSSSGEVGGVYTLYSENIHSEVEDEQELSGRSK